LSSHETKSSGVHTQEARYCLLCGSEGNVVYKDLSDRLFSAPGTWNLRKCPSPDCELIWLDPMPMEADLARLYETYFTHQVNPNKSPSWGSWKSLLRSSWIMLLRATRVSQERFSVATMYLADHKPGKLLDVGCGSGGFLQRMRATGWDVYGIEVDPQAGKIAQDAVGAHVHIGSLAEAAFPDDSFDAVTMNHVIEHVHDPIGILRECRRVLKPSGHLVVVTPNVNSIGHSRFQQNWYGLDPPRHLYLFSQATLLASVQKAGFQEYATWTTAANAETFALGSIGIRTGAIMGGAVSLRRHVAAKWFQIQALIHQRQHPDAGEELVLVAVRL